jgi:diacylglycerol kinase (ATP)
MLPNANKSEELIATASALKSIGGFARIGKAFQYSMQGLSHAVRFEAAFRQELMIAIPAMIGLWFLPVSVIEKIVLLGTVLLLLIVELLNSAIEATVDRVSTERHPLSGRAKDLGSAAVLLAVILMVTAWALIAGPLVLKLL